jgi:(2Fe-2S) ferredoxin
LNKQQYKRIRPLVGYFLGWGDDRTPHRYIKIATSEGEQVVKVGKSLRSQIQDWQPGIWLTLLSQERINSTTGAVKIKVKQLLTSPRVDPPERVSSNLPQGADCSLDADRSTANSQIRVCQGSSCRRQGSEQICRSIQAYLDRHALNDRVEIQPTKCLHQCKSAPHAIFTNSNRELLPGKTHYRKLHVDRVQTILERHFPIDLFSNSNSSNLIGEISNYLRKHLTATLNKI